MKKILLGVWMLFICVVMGAQGSHANDMAKLVAFMNQTNGAGQANWEILGMGSATDWIAVYGRITWAEKDNEMRLTKFDVFNRGVVGTLDLSGCTALTELDCSRNALVSLNVSGCTALTELDCSRNALVSLNVSGCTALTKLDCNNTSLPSLNVSGCTALEELYCRETALKSLDVSGLKELKTLSCSYNPLLVSLNVEGCEALESLACHYTSLSSLDVSDCKNLEYLYCDNTKITDLNLTGYSALEKLDCYQTPLQNLDVSGCVALGQLNCYETSLTELDLSDCPALWALNCRNSSLTSLTLNEACKGNLTHLDTRMNDLEATLEDELILYMFPGDDRFYFFPQKYDMQELPETRYYTVDLILGEGIALYNLSAGEHTVEEGKHLYIQFLPEDRSLTAGDVIFLIDGVDTAFKDLGGSYYFSYILNPVTRDHTIEILLKEPDSPVTANTRSALPTVSFLTGGGWLEVTTAVTTEVRIYTLSGYSVFSQALEGTARVTLPAGVYILRAGKETRKIVIP